MTKIITAKGVESEIPLPKKVVFNHTNDSVDWASWTWNPVTGCEHGCSFCYAREIANSQRMAPYYPNGFEPTFHPYRLAAPKNSSVPTSADQRDGRVFVCSMADLFGKWVPNSWIRHVFDACIESPEWEYLFLTKWPARYSAMPLIQNAWYGSSVIRQSDVSRVESAMCKFSGDGIVKWVSLEPMTEPIRFNDISWCDLMVIGGQTSTNQPDGFVPEFAPDFDWVFDVVDQCRNAGVPYYIKANLGLARPGMKLPNPQPRGRQ
jgi:protein gp37